MARWQCDENIGHGRFGVVFSCREEGDPKGEYPWAYKRLQSDMAQIEQVVNRFEREIAILAALNHENVMKVIDSGAARNGIPWFVMPRAPDGNLKDAIEDGRSADREWVVTVFRGVLAGVAHAHERNVLHRDLKPGNILLFSEQPRVSDFGIAKQVDLDGTTLTTTAQELGTLRYMAPEQLANAKGAGPPADVFALGKILAHMLSGIQPEYGKVDLTGVPEEFRFFIDKCCRDKPEARYPDAGAALVEFEQILIPAAMALPPLERAQELAEGAAKALGTDREREAIDQLAAHFRAFPAEPGMYRQAFPALDKRLVRAWVERDLDSFRDVLAIYDEHAAGRITFEYADVIADFFAYLFGITDDLGVQRIVIARMIATGFDHNRFHVGDVVTDLLASLSSPSEVAVAVEAIDNNQRAAEWYAENTLRRPLRQPIADALRRAQHALTRGQASSG